MPELPEPKHHSRHISPSPGTPGEGRGEGFRLSTSSPYAELDLTTNYSFLRGASHPDELISTAASLGYTAVAVTDLNSLAGVVRAHVAARESRIPLCVGCRLRFTDAPDILVWAENRAGYANLCRTLTTGKRRAEKGQCLLKLQDLLNAPAGLSAALVPQRIDPENTANPPLPQTIGPLRDAFAGRLSLAISRLYGSAGTTDDSIQSIARDYAIPLLATNQVHYHRAERRTLQDVLTCIRHGCTIHQAGWRLFPNGERHLKSPHQMQSLFSDIPHALRRTVEVAQRCTFSLDELRYEYPDEVVPPGQTAGSYLAELAWTGAAARYPAGIPNKVRRQIEHELTLIAQLKIEAYFLTVYDLVHFARGRGILCQGRGSAANSAVCYCIGITSVDPARIDVLFERFVSAARDEPPDIDIDFEHERREEVIQYIYDKYGRDRAGMTAEVITYRGRSAVRDVGKALGLGLDAVDSLAKRLEGWHAAAPLDDQIAAAGIDPTDSTIRLVVSLTRELLGFPRHLSQHVGGMVMTRGALCDLVPIENASMENRTVIEWDKNDIDALGILKVDVLALGMLTAISKALTLLVGWAYPPTGLSDGGRVHPPYELHTIPAEDPAVYDMICDADTVGVFQIESRAQMSMLPRLKPQCFYDLVIEVAIVRPGPIQGDMVHPYLRRRAGLEEVSFPKPQLQAVLGKTLGVPLFQEQAMRVAMVAAGFSAGEADQLRRAMAAWRRSGAIEFFHAKIVDGMLANGYERDFAERCFNQIKGFGEYGFPESHAASFALLVYASAWIKRYHPAAFCCALLNSQPMGFYAPAQLVRDARDHGVEVRPVDVNHSEWDCTLEELTPASPSSASSPSPGTPGEGRGGGSGPATQTKPDPHPNPLPEYQERGPENCPPKPALRLGFRLIRGLHESHARRIAACRTESGPFQSVDHFHETTSLPVAAIRRLSEADAFSSLPMTRRIALWETLALPSERPELESPTKVHTPAPLLPLQTKGQEIRADYRTIGLSLKGHPLALIRPFLSRRKIISAVRVWDHPHGTWIKVAGLVLVRQRPGTAGGIVFATLEDETGIVNLIIRPDVYDRYRDAARHAALLQAEGYLQREGKVQHLLAAKMIDLSDALSDCATRSRDFR